MIYLTADHGGFALKNKVLEYLKREGFDVSDEGPFELKPDDDYPDYVVPVMEKVQVHPENRAILFCRNGVGVNIVANKFKGIRAALSWNSEHAASSRFDDDTNVLTIPSDYLSEIETIAIIQAWLNTQFSHEERHIRRINKIMESEKK